MNIRPMHFTDIEQAMLLVKEAHWNQTPEDWALLLNLKGTHLVATDDGTIAGSIAGIDYGAFVWVAMVLVLPTYRRRGIATALMEQILEKYPDRLIRLDATAGGARVYEQLGFKSVDHLTRWYHPGRSVNHPMREDRAVIPIGMHRKEILRQDKEIFGADRSAVLSWLLEKNPGQCQQMTDSGTPAYILGRPGTRAWQIGPLIAGHPEQAATLLHAILASFPERSFYLDAFDLPGWPEKLAQAGFQRQRDFIRMQRRSKAAVGIRAMQFAIAGPELG
jgi:GNAT superfamily N-acetyltransferase